MFSELRGRAAKRLEKAFTKGNSPRRLLCRPRTPNMYLVTWCSDEYSPFLTSLCGFSAGTDGSVDFGILKVMDDAKQVLTLKNRGKYEIAYRWVRLPGL